MGNLRVRLKIDIGRGEHDPFAVGRRHRFIDPFEFHHVLKPEGVLWLLCLGEQRPDDEKAKGDEFFQVCFYFVIPSEAEESRTTVRPLFDRNISRCFPFGRHDILTLWLK